jgi:hypothetical protein
MGCQGDRVKQWLTLTVAIVIAGCGTEMEIPYDASYTRPGPPYGADYPVDVAVFAGQSNNQTHNVIGPLPGLPTPLVYNWVKSNNNYVYASSAIEFLGPKDVAGTLHYGPWCLAGKMIRDRFERPLLVIMFSQGATTIATWHSNQGGGVLYNDFRDTVAAARAAFGGKQNIYQIWSIGESNAASSAGANATAANFQFLLAEQRALYGAGMKAYILQLSDQFTSLAFRSTVRDQLVSYVASDPNAYLVDAAVGPSGIQGDALHYNALGVSIVASAVAQTVRPQ